MILGKKISSQEAIETIRFAAEEARAEHIYLMSVIRAVSNPPEGQAYEFYSDGEQILPLLVKAKKPKKRVS